MAAAKQSEGGSVWLQMLQNAKSTAMVQDGRVKSHYTFEDGREMVEEHDADSANLLGEFIYIYQATCVRVRVRVRVRACARMCAIFLYLLLQMHAFLFFFFSMTNLVFKCK